MLVVHGTEDRILPFEATAARLPALIDDVELVPVEGGPHNIGWTHPDEVNGALLEFLAATAAGDGVMASRKNNAARARIRRCPTRRVTADNAIEYAYRDLGESDVPLVLLQHFRGNLDNWDPALIDALAADRRVVTFDNVGVGATTGRTPSTVEAMAHDAIAFLEAMDLQRVDLLGFSLGSFVAQEIALIRPDLLRRVVLASSAPQGAAGMHGWAPEVIGAVGRAGDRARRDTSPSSSPPRTRVARRASRPPGASSAEGRPTETSRRRGRPARRSTTPSARGASRTTRCSSGSPRSICRCSSPTATATR